ncbi:hypothetical protein N9Z57_01190, partial [Akkermansiaceae bacterium]|nr:hypothetical protein [Akkermansiaceae bacterium]
CRQVANLSYFHSRHLTDDSITQNYTTPVLPDLVYRLLDHHAGNSLADNWFGDLSGRFLLLCGESRVDHFVETCS